MKPLHAYVFILGFAIGLLMSYSNHRNDQKPNPEPAVGRGLCLQYNTMVNRWAVWPRRNDGSCYAEDMP